MYICVCMYSMCMLKVSMQLCVHVGPYACEGLLCPASCSVPQEPESFVSSIMMDLDPMVSLGFRPVLGWLVLS